MMALSVIIPVSKNDMMWMHLINDLNFLEANDEVIFVAPESKITEMKCSNIAVRPRIRFLASEPGRANQLNAGALAAKHDVLWFVHCDCRFNAAAVHSLKKAISDNESGLCYFDLKFLSDGPIQMKLTEIGVLFRSRVLKLPFGDQAFCIKRKLFDAMGGFRTDVPYGEDHLFVWQARQMQIEIRALKTSIHTSARKYSLNGWCHTTLHHVYLTLKQAMPQLVRMASRKVH